MDFGHSTAADQFILRIHSLGCAVRICTNCILEYNNVARPPHGIIRFRGHDHGERLKIRGYVELAAVIIAHQNFTKVDRTSFGGNRL